MKKRTVIFTELIVAALLIIAAVIIENIHLQITSCVFLIIFVAYLIFGWFSFRYRTSYYWFTEFLLVLVSVGLTSALAFISMPLFVDVPFLYIGSWAITNIGLWLVMIIPMKRYFEAEEFISKFYKLGKGPYGKDIAKDFELLAKEDPSSLKTYYKRAGLHNPEINRILERLIEIKALIQRIDFLITSETYSFEPVAFSEDHLPIIPYTPCMDPWNKDAIKQFAELLDELQSLDKDTFEIYKKTFDAVSKKKTVVVNGKAN